MKILAIYMAGHSGAGIGRCPIIRVDLEFKHQAMGGVGVGGMGVGGMGAPIMTRPVMPEVREVVFRNGVVVRADKP